MRGNDLKLHQMKFRLYIRKNFFAEIFFTGCQELEQAAQVVSPSLEVFIGAIDVVFRDMV